MSKFIHGCHADKYDGRDLFFTAAHAPSALPAKIDLSTLMPPVYDQGQIGSCTANAIAGAIEYEQAKQKLRQFVPSRLFIYYNEREIEQTINQDAGAQIRDGIKTVNKIGVCDEIIWPYDTKEFKATPPKHCYDVAAQNKVIKYARVKQTLTNIKSCLASEYPVVFGFNVYTSFEGNEVATTGILNMPAHGEKCVGGHAVLIVGYNDAKQSFLVRNSWGASWGLSGYFWMPYEYVINHKLANDFWQINLID